MDTEMDMENYMDTDDGYGFQDMKWTRRGVMHTGDSNLRNKNRIRKYLKGVCHKIFDLNLFSDLNPSGPPDKHGIF